MFFLIIVICILGSDQFDILFYCTDYGQKIFSVHN